MPCPALPQADELEQGHTPIRHITSAGVYPATSTALYFLGLQAAKCLDVLLMAPTAQPNLVLAVARDLLERPWAWASHGSASLLEAHLRQHGIQPVLTVQQHRTLALLLLPYAARKLEDSPQMAVSGH